MQISARFTLTAVRSFLLLASLFISMLFTSVSSAKSFVWLDLGDVIVDTRGGFDNIKYMPGAIEYVGKLRSEGHQIGLIINIPENMGTPGDYDSKKSALLNFIRKGWKDQRPFTFRIYDEVLLPLFDRERKPAPHLFEMAKGLSQGLKMVFQGEREVEVQAADKAGMMGFWVRYDASGAPIFLDPIFIP